MRDIGIVLGGGGAKGAYQIGVFKALSEYNFYNFTKYYSGASIGGLNLALIQLMEPQKAAELWLGGIDKIFISDNINVNEVMEMLRRVKTNKPLKKSYLCDRGELVNLFESVKMDQLQYSKNNLVVSCTDISKIPDEIRGIKAAIAWYEGKSVGSVDYLSLNGVEKEKIYKTLLATSSIPLLYNPVYIDNRFYIDGGITDNLPIKPLYNMGCRKMIVVPCNRVNANYLQKKYPDVDMLFIQPSQYLGNIFEGTLNFNKSKIRSSIHLGYSDAKSILKRSKFLRS